jgi:hypothetical protein
MSLNVGVKSFPSGQQPPLSEVSITLVRFTQEGWYKTAPKMYFCKNVVLYCDFSSVVIDTLRTGYGDLRFYITTVEDGLRRSPFVTR